MSDTPGSHPQTALVQGQAEYLGELRRHQAAGAHGRASHRVRGGALSQPSRVLGHAWNGKLHDPGGHLHEALQVLRRGHRASAGGGHPGASPGGRLCHEDGPEARPRHDGQPRRPSGRRRVGDGCHRAGHPRTRTGLLRGSAHLGFHGLAGRNRDRGAQAPRTS